MFDIQFYKMLKYFIDFHNDINNYNKYKILKNKGELGTLYNETLNKFNLGYKDYADIQLYIRLVYCYFSNYSLGKLQKQINQVNMNKRTSIKNDIMV